MNKKLLGGLGAVTLVTALAVAFVPTIGGNITYALSRSSSSYSCNDIVFSETVNNPGAYTDIDDLSSKGVTSLDCSMTNWTYANYGSTMTSTAIKIGGSSAGKYSGSVKLTLKNMTTSRLIVYAAGWAGDSETQSLGINGTYQDVIKTAKGTTTYTFEAYMFDLSSKTSEIIISNNPDATGARRIVISKIVLRLHNESGGDTPVDPPVSSQQTLIIDSSNFLNINGGSGYAAYNGTHIIGEFTIISSNVMIDKENLQFRKSPAGTLTITRSGDKTFTIKTVEGLTITDNIITNTSGSALYCKIEITYK